MLGCKESTELVLTSCLFRSINGNTLRLYFCWHEEESSAPVGIVVALSNKAAIEDCRCLVHIL